MTNWYVYMIELSNSSLYTGITNNIQKRMEKHRSGSGSKYVRAHLPFFLVYVTECSCKSSALKLERKIKTMKRANKIKLLCDRSNMVKEHTDD